MLGRWRLGSGCMMVGSCLFSQSIEKGICPEDGSFPCCQAAMRTGADIARLQAASHSVQQPVMLFRGQYIGTAPQHGLAQVGGLRANGNEQVNQRTIGLRSVAPGLTQQNAADVTDQVSGPLGDGVTQEIEHGLIGWIR